MHVDIVSAEEEIFSGTATMLFAPAEMGEVGIKPRHAQMITRLVPGEVVVRDLEGSEQLFFISGGVLEVQPHIVTVLSDTAIRAKDLDEAAALEAKKRAEQHLEDRQSGFEYATARAELAAAAAQLRAIQKLRNKS
ncbi:MAG: F0F1 ATP synthase subunit epsilon [Arenicellales bacterium]|nr:F0F1 ATP synthase subunit epsilon [Arenicellales bacterium]MDP7521717.1 F0F1 ATP synthase subunit epsilon [Arenicellales bacterium]